MKTRVLAVVGPTASGKTALSVHLAQAYGGEIVSADSMQIYTGMHIATAKPSQEEMGGIPHHLMDFLPPTKTFSVSQYVELAKQAMDEIAARGKLPIVCGGTGLYIRSLTQNVQFSPECTDETLREELNRRYREEGGEALLRELAVFDPVTARKLHPSNSKRIIRAMELYRTTGVTMSEQVEQSRQVPSPYDWTLIGIAFADRQNLYDRINRRVDKMLADGLLEEAERFYQSTAGKTAAAAIGYKELKPYLDGAVPLEQAVEHLKQETRRYAKRQLTWFKKDQEIFWIEADRCGDVFEEARRHLSAT